MSNIINEIKKHNGVSEDIELDVIDKGFRRDEYTLVLGPKQKQMLIDAVEKNPYGVLRYYFLKSAESPSEDLKLMKSLIDEWWELQPERGYLNLKIITDDATYTNRLDDEETIKELTKSIDELHEILKEEFDFVDDVGFLRDGPFNKVYILGAAQKSAIIEMLRSLGPNGVSGFNFPSGTADFMEECIGYPWVLMDYDVKWNTFYLLPSKGQPLDIPEKYLVNIIPQESLDAIKGSVEKVEEDFETVDSTAVALAEAIAEQIGDCKVVDNVVYQLMEDFEIWNNDFDFQEVDSGIFWIFEVTDNSITSYNSKASTCREIELIGKESMDYFAGDVAEEFHTLRDFIRWLDNYFGRDWFGDYESREEFINKFAGTPLVPEEEKHVEEDIELDTVDLDDHQKAIYSDGYVELSDEQKEDVSAFLGFEDDDWDLYGNKTWILTKNCPELDSWYSEDEDEEFPYALIIDGQFIDALSKEAAESIIGK